MKMQKLWVFNPLDSKRNLDFSIDTGQWMIGINWYSMSNFGGWNICFLCFRLGYWVRPEPPKYEHQEVSATLPVCCRAMKDWFNCGTSAFDCEGRDNCGLPKKDRQ